MSSTLDYIGKTPVIINNNDNEEIVGLSITVQAGSFCENKEVNGISHLLEHILFKGTQNGYSARDINLISERSGGSINAFTTKDSTTYYVKGIKKNFHIFCDLLFSLVFLPTFEQTEIDKEKQVILNEIAELNDDPEELLTEEIEKLIFKDNTLSMPIAGTAKSVLNITRNDLVEYHEAHYTRGLPLVVATGGVDKDILFSFTEKYITKYGTNTKKTPEESNFNIVNGKKDIGFEQVYIGTVYEAFPSNDKNIMTLWAIDAVFASGMSSRLYQKLREELALCYSIDGGLSLFKTGGYGGVYFACEPKNVQQLLKAFDTELQTLLKNGFTDEEADIAKNQLKYQLFAEWASYSGRMGALNRAFLNSNELYDINKQINIIDSINAQSMTKLFRQLLDKGYSRCQIT